MSTVGPAHGQTVLPLSRAIRLASQRLLAGRHAAENIGVAPWEFASQLADLHAAGVADATLRWLVCRGFVEHRIEITRHFDSLRRFKPACNLRFKSASCFVLTSTGVLAAEQRDEIDVEPIAGASGSDTTSITPHWSAGRRILFVADTIVKKYRVPAENQELILRAFEEESWPLHLDDPLPPRCGLDPKRRLHDTIKALNGHHRSKLIRFEGDGTGCGVCWRLLPPHSRFLAPASTPDRP